MELIIDIPDEVYNTFHKGNWSATYEGKKIRDIVMNGTPLSEQSKWIFVSEKLPNNHEYIKNNGLFNVSDGNRSYFGWFDIYGTKKFVKPTIAGFLVDNAVIAWMSLPEPCKAESEVQDANSD